nr:hypothetical protein KPHV_05980 [Kitasatospora purpeofusca]
MWSGLLVSCSSGEVVHVADGLHRVVQAVALLSAVAEDLPVLHAGEGALDAGAYASPGKRPGQDNTGVAGVPETTSWDIPDVLYE